MIIKVTGYLTYRDVIGKREVERSDDVRITFFDFIRELAAELGGQHGQALFNEEASAVGGSVAIMLNGVHYNHLPDRLETVMIEG